MRTQRQRRHKRDSLLQWHPAFYANIQIAFTKESEKLIFENEHQLGTKPKEIDVLIIKKEGTQPIQKNIGRIFRRHNIVEYKAPGDYFSIDDYYKVYGYACFYKADARRENQIALQEITISLVCHSYPRKLMRHLIQERKCRIDWIEDGIYYVFDELFPVQIIVTRELEKTENIWLRGMTNNLCDRQEINDLLEEYTVHQNEALYSSVMDIIVKANRERFEDKNMCEALEEILAPKIKEYVAEGEAKQIVELGTEFGLSANEILNKLQSKLNIPMQRAEEYLTSFKDSGILSEAKP